MTFTAFFTYFHRQILNKNAVPALSSVQLRPTPCYLLYRGKRRIASNALKHGLFSDTRINLSNEDHDFVKTLLTDLQGEYCPVTPTEHILVQQLATLQTRFLRAQTHYLALIDNQAEDMYLALKEKFAVDPDTDSRYALAFQKQTQSNRALEILSREIDRLPNKIRKTIEMLVWFRQVPAAEPVKIEEQSQFQPRSRGSAKSAPAITPRAAPP